MFILMLCDVSQYVPVWLYVLLPVQMHARFSKIKSNGSLPLSYHRTLWAKTKKLKNDRPHDNRNEKKKRTHRKTPSKISKSITNNANDSTKLKIIIIRRKEEGDKKVDLKPVF